MTTVHPYQHIVEVKRTTGREANKLLKKGWELTGVYPRRRAVQPSEGNPFHIVSGVITVVGRPRDIPEEENPQPEIEEAP